MAVISMTASIRPSECSLGQLRFDTMERSDSTGSENARLLAPPRWTLSMASPDHLTLTEAGAWETMQIKLRGGVNVLAAYDPVRQAPEGTLRGTPELATTAAAGATSMVLTKHGGGTLRMGDWLGIGTGLGTSQLVKVVEDCAAEVAPITWVNDDEEEFTWTGTSPFGWDGEWLIVPFEPPLRRQYVAGTVVAWDKPLGYYRMQGSPKWRYSTQAYRRQGAFAVDLVETFS